VPIVVVASDVGVAEDLARGPRCSRSAPLGARSWLSGRRASKPQRHRGSGSGAARKERGGRPGDSWGATGWAGAERAASSRWSLRVNSRGQDFLAPTGPPEPSSSQLSSALPSPLEDHAVGARSSPSLHGLPKSTCRHAPAAACLVRDPTGTGRGRPRPASSAATGAELSVWRSTSRMAASSAPLDEAGHRPLDGRGGSCHRAAFALEEMLQMPPR
jgi:hypothetical protein